MRGFDVPAEVNVVIAEVANMFSSSNIFHHIGFQEPNEEEHLQDSSNRNCLESGESVWDVGEFEPRVIDVSWRMPAS
jgi:hypothetical protein